MKGGEGPAPAHAQGDASEDANEPPADLAEEPAEKPRLDAKKKTSVAQVPKAEDKKANEALEKLSSHLDQIEGKVSEITKKYDELKAADQKKE